MISKGEMRKKSLAIFLFFYVFLDFSNISRQEIPDSGFSKIPRNLRQTVSGGKPSVKT